MKKRKAIWNRLSGKPIGQEKRNPFTEKIIKRVPKKRRRTTKWELQNKMLGEGELQKRGIKSRIGIDETARNISTMRTRSKKANFRKRSRPQPRRAKF